MGWNFTGSILNGLSGGFYGITNPGSSGKDKVPPLLPIDIDQVQRDAVTANQNILPGAEAIGRQVNAFNRDELEAMYSQALPGYEQIKANIGRNAASLTAGEIPQDVQDAVLRNSAVRALNGGYGGYGMARNLTARDLGLTSLDLMGKGQESAQRWMESAKTPTFDVTSMFISPLDRLSFKSAERNIKFDRDWLSSQIKELGSKDEQMLRNMISNY